MFNVYRTTILALIVGFNNNTSLTAQVPAESDVILKRMQERRIQEAKIAERERAELDAARRNAKESATERPTPDVKSAIKDLTFSKDPGIAAAARELLGLLTKAAPTTCPPGNSKNSDKTEAMPVGRKGEGVTKVLVIERHESSLKHSADGKTVAVIGTDGSITLYDVATGREWMKFPAKK
jgi:hypothetical protein